MFFNSLLSMFFYLRCRTLDFLIFGIFNLIWVVVSNNFYFRPYLGKWSNLTNIFQMGWNHHLVILVEIFWHVLGHIDVESNIFNLYLNERKVVDKTRLDSGFPYPIRSMGLAYIWMIFHGKCRSLRSPRIQTWRDSLHQQVFEGTGVCSRGCLPTFGWFFVDDLPTFTIKIIQML